MRILSRTDSFVFQSEFTLHVTHHSLVNFTLNTADTRKYIHLKFDYTRYLQLLLGLFRASP